MKKLILFFIALSCWGQTTGQNVINQTFSLVIPANSSGQVVSTLIQNIGQTSHSFLATDSAIAGNPTGTINVTVQGAADNAQNGCGNNTQWLNIGPQTVIDASKFNLAPFLGSGYQSYPCLRISAVYSITGGPITLQVNYQGNSSPSHNLVDSLSLDNGLSVLSTTASSGGSVVVLPTNLLSYSNVIYWMVLDIPSTASGGVTLKCNTSGTGGTTYLNIQNATGLLTFPAGIRNYFACPQENQLVLVSGGGTGTIAITVGYRLE